MAKLEEKFQLPLEKITPEHLKNYLQERIVIEEISTTLINQHISAFKIVQQDVLGRAWETMKIKRPRREKKLPQVLSLKEVEQIISAVANLKHRTMLMLLYSAGLRAQELLVISPKHIVSHMMRVNVVGGKGKKDRYTLLSQKVLEKLRDYYKIYKPRTYLFESGGRSGKYLSKSSLDKIIKNAAAKAGIKKNISAHTFRHSFATHLLEQGVNIRLIQQFMGHVSIKTTSVYLHLVSSDIKNLISPLDSMDI